MSNILELILELVGSIFFDGLVGDWIADRFCSKLAPLSVEQSGFSLWRILIGVLIALPILLLLIALTAIFGPT